MEKFKDLIPNILKEGLFFVFLSQLSNHCNIAVMLFFLCQVLIQTFDLCCVQRTFIHKFREWLAQIQTWSHWTIFSGCTSRCDLDWYVLVSPHKHPQPITQSHTHTITQSHKTILPKEYTHPQQAPIIKFCSFQRWQYEPKILNLPEILFFMAWYERMSSLLLDRKLESVIWLNSP
jgi:hypothetical protein